MVVTLEWASNSAQTHQESYWLFSDADDSAWYMSASTSGVKGEALYAGRGWLEPLGGTCAKDAAELILMKIWLDELKLDKFRGREVRVSRSGLLEDQDIVRIVQRIGGT